MQIMWSSSVFFVNKLGQRDHVGAPDTLSGVKYAPM